jgi:hypothetical protein
MLVRAFETLYREGAQSGRVMPIPIHPFVIGVPHRIGALEAALRHIQAFDGVWCATADDIVAAYVAGDPKV